MTQVADLARGRRGREPQLPRLGHLVGGEYGQRLVAGGPHLLAQRGLAGRVADDVLVLGDRDHEIGDVVAELLAQVLAVDAGLLDDVVQDARGDDVVGRAGLLQQQGNLDRMGDERRSVDPASLSRVGAGGVGERLACEGRRVGTSIGRASLDPPCNLREIAVGARRRSLDRSR